MYVDHVYGGLATGGGVRPKHVHHVYVGLAMEGGTHLLPDDGKTT